MKVKRVAILLLILIIIAFVTLRLNLNASTHRKAESVKVVIQEVKIKAANSKNESIQIIPKVSTADHLLSILTLDEIAESVSVIYSFLYSSF